MADALPNIVLISIDSLRADRLGSYGYERDISPTIDTLAANGILFMNAFANGPATKVSFPATFTSTLPFYRGTYADINNRVSFVPLLKKHGYATGGFHRNPWLKPVYGYGDGFDVFDYKDTENMRLQRIKDVVKELDVPFMDWLVAFYRKRHQSSAETQNREHEQANQFLTQFQQEHEEPYFVWLHSHATHQPYLPPTDIREEVRGDTSLNEYNQQMLRNIQKRDDPTEKQKRDVNDLYDGCVLWADRFVSQVVEHIDLDNTIVMFIADHGEQLWDHGSINHSELYDEILRVPLIVHLPDHDGDTVDTLVQLADIPTTILELVDAPVPDTYRGQSVFDAPADRPIVSQVAKGEKDRVRDRTDIFLASLRTTQYKYIFSPETGDTLYDLENDPHETVNIADKHPDTVQELRQTLENEDGIPEGRAVERDVTDEETKRRLRELGYLE